MFVEQVNSALMQLILGVLETMITQDGVDIFFPKPRSIKEDSAVTNVPLMDLNLKGDTQYNMGEPLHGDSC